MTLCALPDLARADRFALDGLIREHAGYPDLIASVDVDVAGVRADLLHAGTAVVIHLILDVFGEDLVPVDTGTKSLMTRSWRNGDPAELVEVDAAERDPDDVVAYRWFQLVPEHAFSGERGRRFAPAPAPAVAR